MDEVEVLEHVEPIDDRLEDLALHPEYVGVAIALMHLMRLMGEIGEEIDDERRGKDVRDDPQRQHLAPTAEHREPEGDAVKDQYANTMWMVSGRMPGMWAWKAMCCQKYRWYQKTMVRQRQSTLNGPCTATQ